MVLVVEMRTRGLQTLSTIFYIIVVFFVKKCNIDIYRINHIGCSFSTDSKKNIGINLFRNQNHNLYSIELLNLNTVANLKSHTFFNSLVTTRIILEKFEVGI